METHTSLKLLLLSTSVGALGSGLGGGVELTLQNIAQVLIQQGHQIQVVAPIGSILKDIPLVQIPGNLQVMAQSQGRDEPMVFDRAIAFGIPETPIAMPENSVLANMWSYARRVQCNYDLLVNFAYDWLPFYLTPFFSRPIAHLVSMGSLNRAMDQIIEQVAIEFPRSIGVHSHAQAATFSFANQCRVLHNGLDLSLYQFCSEPEPMLAWVGRIAPEKGVEDAIAAAQSAGLPLKIWGTIQDAAYWEKLQSATVHYGGFLPTQQLQQELGRCLGLLVTPRWVEAFGNVAIEALACGVPVVAYRRGGPAEIVRDGKTGWLVEPDSIEELVAAIARLHEIDRRACRQQAEAEYSLAAMGDRVEQWLWEVLRARFRKS